MGMEHLIRLPGPALSLWPGFVELLARSGFLAELRMIDGGLSFPDEAPAETWRELRLSTPQGMVTVIREGALVRTVTWGNADAALRQAWSAITWAIAETGTGRVESCPGSPTAEEFRRQADMPACLQLDSV